MLSLTISILFSVTQCFTGISISQPIRRHITLRGSFYFVSHDIITSSQANNEDTLSVISPLHPHSGDDIMIGRMSVSANQSPGLWLSDQWEARRWQEIGAQVSPHLVLIRWQSIALMLCVVTLNPHPERRPLSGERRGELQLRNCLLVWNVERRPPQGAAWPRPRRQHNMPGIVKIPIYHKLMVQTS